MKYNVFIILILFFITWHANAQVVKFEKVYGNLGYDKGNSVIQTLDNGYIVVGSTSSFGNGVMDAFLLKVDSMGVQKLQRTYGGINIDIANSVKETPDSGLIITGYTNSFGNGGYDAYLIRTNANGDTLWTKTYGGSNWDFAYSVEPTNDGGYIIAGATYSFGHGNEDMYLVKLNSSGDTIWTKTYGGINDDEARCVKQTSDGGYIITGNTKSFGDLNGDLYTIKTDVNGDTLWTYKYPGALTDESYDILESPLGRYFIGGRSKSVGSGNFDGIAIQISLSGSYLSHVTYGGTSDDGVNSIALAPGGRFAVIGYTYTYGYANGTDDYYMYIQNPYNGDHATTFGGNKMESGNSISNTRDGGYIMCGNSTSYSNFEHIYLVKTDSNGVSSGTVISVIIGIGEELKKKTLFNIFPNPANDIFFIEIPTGHFKGRIIIRDVLGKECYSQIINPSVGKIEIHTSQLNQGIYVICVEQNNEMTSQRLIIQH
jgi:hypothetical protein